MPVKMPAVACLALAGCSSGGVVFESGDGGGASTSDKTTVGSLSSVHDDDATTALATVLVTSSEYLEGGVSAQGSAAWARYTVGPGDEGCSSEVLGPCTVRICDSTTPAPSLEEVSAGPLTIEGRTRDVALVPSGAHYPVESADSSLFSAQGGEPLHFDVGGSDEVPAHQATLAAPSRVVVLDLGSAGEAVLIPRSRDFTLRWEPGVTGVVTVSIGVADGHTAYRAECRFPAAAAVGTIPALALSPLPATLEGGGDLRIDVVTSEEVEARRFSVSVLPSTVATTETRARAVRAITLD